MSEKIVIENAMMIDGKGGDPLPDAQVTVANGIIQSIETGRARRDGCRVIDLYGKTLLPGLIDAHVHPGNIEMRTSQTTLLSPAVYVIRAARNLETDLMLGYTTVRDAAGLDRSFREAIDQRLIKGPRLMLSVTPLTQSGGSTPGWGLGQDQPQSRNSLGIYPEICDGPNQVLGAARRALGRGADQIKIFADGEVIAMQPSDRAVPGNCKFTVEELKAAVQVAEAAGTYVMAHAYSPKAIQNCLAAGVRSIEHGNMLDEPTAQLMAENGAYLVPTLTVYDVFLKKGKEIGLDDFSLDKLRLVGQMGIQALEIAFRKGIKIGSGSDIIGPMQALKGREFALKAEVMSPMETIVSATKTNAELMGLSEKIGTIEPGKAADLIVIDGNPLNDLSLFERGIEKVVLVMTGGRIVKNLLE